MEKMRPKIFSVGKNYSKQQLINDMRAGILVAVIALPLSIAFAISSGVSAEKGIYSSIISSIVVALLGGSRVQITGPTGAFIIITQSILTGYGRNGLMIATIMAGVMLLLMGIFKLGKLIRFIPAPITIGFTGGIAITIFTLEIKDFLGITVDKMPANFFAKWGTYIKHISTINLSAVFLGVICIVILIVWPKVNKLIPNSLIALTVGTTIAYVAKLDVKTLGMIPRTLTVPSLSRLSLDEFFELVSPAFTIAILVAMQALLSAVVTDGIINSKHRANMELAAQGIANTILGLLGCIPATGGVARSIANAKNGGRTPIAAIFHGITLFFLFVVCMPLLQYVPLCVLASILIVVACNMFQVKAFLSYRKAPRSDVAVLIASCVLTFAFDLVLAIEVGMVMSCILFMKRMSDVTEVKGWTYLRDMDNLDEDNDPDALNLKAVPKHTLVFEVSGPMFFGAADKLIQLTGQVTEDIKVVVVRMRSVPAIDITAINSLKKVHQHLAKNNVTMVFSHVLEQPVKAMRKAGFVDTVGDENICESLDAALDRAEKLSAI